MRLIRIPAVLALVLAAACDLNTSPNVPDPIDPADDTYATALGVDLSTMTKLPSGLYYKDLTPGSGTGAAAVNDSVKAHFTLWLTNGTKVDSSIDGGSPIEFKIGDPTIIPGFSEGFLGMLPGGRRQLVIPTHLAWGQGGSRVAGKPPIPPNANVVFEIEFIERLTGGQ